MVSRLHAHLGMRMHIWPRIAFAFVVGQWAMRHKKLNADVLNAYLSDCVTFQLISRLFLSAFSFTHWEWGMGSGKNSFFSFPRIELRFFVANFQYDNFISLKNWTTFFFLDISIHFSTHFTPLKSRANVFWIFLLCTTSTTVWKQFFVRSRRRRTYTMIRYHHLVVCRQTMKIL